LSKAFEHIGTTARISGTVEREEEERESLVITMGYGAASAFPVLVSNNRHWPFISILLIQTLSKKGEI